MSDIPVSNSRLRAARCAGSVILTSGPRPRVQVAVHHVRAADPDLGLAAVAEGEDTGVFEGCRALDRTRMFSDRPATPGRTAQMPRTHTSMRGPRLGRAGTRR